LAWIVSENKVDLSRAELNDMENRISDGPFDSDRPLAAMAKVSIARSGTSAAKLSREGKGGVSD
jgi:hypothetical protein